MAPRIHNFALHWGKWPVSYPIRFTPKERVPSAHWIGDCMGPRYGLELLEKRKIPLWLGIPVLIAWSLY
jgi:hypothetical protein